MSELAGLNTLLFGPPGTGKTYAIASLVATGLDVFYLALENGLPSLLAAFGKAEVPANLHWHVVEPPKAGTEQFLKQVSKLNKLSYAALCEYVDPNRSNYNQMELLAMQLNNFFDMRTGKEFGSVESWGNDKVLVIDGLSGVADAATKNITGGRLMVNKNEYIAIQGQILTLVNLLARQCTCHFVLLAHIDKEVDEVTGGRKLFPALPGQKAIPKLLSAFNNVVMTGREGTKWYWDTLNSQADLRVLSLPMQAKLAPDFRPLVTAWKNGAIKITK